MRHHDHERALVHLAALGASAGLLDSTNRPPPGSARGEERGPVVDDRHVPAEDRGRSHQRDRRVPRRTRRGERWVQHLDERADAAGQRPDLGPVLSRQASCPIAAARRRPRRRATAAVGRSGRTTSRAPPRRGPVRLHHGDHARRPLLQTVALSNPATSAAFSALDEDLDRAVAAEAQAPDRVVVRGEVLAGQRPADLHPPPRGHVRDVALRHPPERLPTGLPSSGNQGSLAPWAPVGGAADRDDRGERHPAPPLAEGTRSPPARRRSRSRHDGTRARRSGCPVRLRRIPILRA